MPFTHVYSKAREMIDQDHTTMPRELSEKDIGILKKLAPECGDLTCSGSGHQFHSILPPVSNHFSEDSNDFIQRISRLNDEELTYITEMIQKGEESMGCLPVEDVEAFVHLVHDRLSEEIAQKVISAYESGYECEH
jgi:hypothetical protein